MKGTVNIEDFISYLKDNDLVITSRAFAENKALKEKIFRKKWITLKEIADSEIWGVKKQAVKVIVREEVQEDAIDKSRYPYKVHRGEVERIAKNRNII